jgi:hypothetical protein
MWGRKTGMSFIAAKIRNRYYYRYYAALKTATTPEEHVNQKRKGETRCETEASFEKKRKARLPEKYCINKKKWFSSATEAELAAELEIVPGADNSRVHRILQYKLT